MTRKRQPRSIVSRIPVELIDMFFENLNQPDILGVASVCSFWRSVAQRKPTYYAAICYRVPTITAPAECETAFEDLQRRVDYVCSRQVSTKITIRVWSPLGNTGRVDNDTFCDLLNSRLPSLLAAGLKFALSIDLLLPPECYLSIVPALCGAAPKLQAFKLQVFFRFDWEVSDDEYLPQNLFGMSAPNLTSVELCMVPFSRLRPVTAFAATVNEVNLQCYENVDVDAIGANFPNVQSLSLGEVGCDTDVVRTVLPQLRFLEYEGDCPAFHSLMKQQSIPVIDASIGSGETCDKISPLLCHMTYPTHLTVSPTANKDTYGTNPLIYHSVITLESPSNCLTRTIELLRPADVGVREVFGFLNLSSHVFNDLAELDIPAYYVEVLAANCDGLPRLRILRTALATQPRNTIRRRTRATVSDPTHLRCPVLQTVVATSDIRHDESGRVELLQGIRCIFGYLELAAKPRLVISTGAFIARACEELSDLVNDISFSIVP